MRARLGPALLAVCFVFALGSPPARAATLFTVNDSGDQPDSATHDAICSTSASTCTLRAAIQQANASGEAADIEIDLPQGDATITPGAALPIIGVPVTIGPLDGAPTPTLDGSSAADPLQEGVLGLYLGSGSDASVVRGLVVIHFTGGGLVILSDNDTIAGNFIGTDPDGASGLGNYDGISILGNGATVGGANPSDRNVVSGNTHAGIYESTVTSVVIQQNYVGIAPDGSTPLGNGSQGMLLRGSATVDANVVAANGTVTPAEGIGIDVQSSGTYFPAVTMTNNVVGADPSATLPRGNLGGGISNTSSQSVQMNGNTVVSNSHFGIRLLGIGFDLRNDLVGINASGTSMGNDGPGILTSDKPGDFIADLGGTEIAFNSGAGIEMIEEGAGSTADSITFDTYGIGTAIHHNGLAGIRATGPHAQIFPNDVTLYSNGHLGIDLGDNGVTPNDAKDLDDGPDALQNFPLLQGAKATADTIDVKWSINTTPSSTPVVRFYSSPSCDPSGYGEGKTYLGFLDGIVTDANGDADGTMQFGGTSAPAIGSFVTSTSSVDDGFASPPTGISEFSNCVKVRRASTSLSLRVVKKTRNLRAKGALTPLLPGRLISVKLLRKRDGAYKLVAKRTAVTNSLSRFAVGFPRPKAGACKLKAVFKGAERYAASSRSLTFRC